MDVSKFRTALRSPSTAFWHLLKQRNQKRAIRVMDEDWDTLLIIDACRADLFREANSLEGTFRTVRSAGTHTGEFLRANFADSEFLDTVYLSANPQVVNYDISSNFLECEFLWESHWDEELETVRPSEVNQRLLEAVQKFPNKRFIVHYVQPHYPFIGETGRAIRHGSITGDGVIADARDHPSVWELLESGDVNKELVWRSYLENLEIVLDAIAEVVEQLDGKTVITSDHGNALGEWGIYGHPGERHIEPLYLVPWLELEWDKRRTIVAADESESSSAEPTAVKERLESLGYVDE